MARGEKVLFRVTKTKWRRPWDYLTGTPKGEWECIKREVVYRTRESDITLARNYAKHYSNSYCKYEVEVEVAFMPRFHDYDEVVKMSPTSLVIGILRARGRASYGEPGQLGQS